MTRARAPWAPTEAQLGELAKLKAYDAVSQETAVGSKAGGGRTLAINGVMLSVALYPKGLVDKVVVAARFGEPKMTLYWITSDGLKVLDGWRR